MTATASMTLAEYASSLSNWELDEVLSNFSVNHAGRGSEEHSVFLSEARRRSLI